MPDTERRRHPRLSLSVDVDFSSAHNFYAGRTRDLSLGGIFIESPIELPMGTHVTVDLAFLDARHAVEGEIVWHVLDEGRVVGMGLRFLGLSGEAEAAIRLFMSTRDPLAFDSSAIPPPLPEKDP